MNLAHTVDLYSGGPGSGPHEPCPQCGRHDYPVVTWISKDQSTGKVIKKSRKCMGCHREEMHMPRSGLDVPYSKRKPE